MIRCYNSYANIESKSLLLSISFYKIQQLPQLKRFISPELCQALSKAVMGYKETDKSIAPPHMFKEIYHPAKSNSENFEE